MKTRKSTPDELIEASKRTFAEIAALAKMTTPQLAKRVGIPRRTAERWTSGDRTPPAYVILLIQEAIGLIKR